MSGKGGVITSAMFHMKNHTDIKNSGFQRSIGTVSYTHLDVYKRQICLLCSISYNFGINIYYCNSLYNVYRKEK